MQVNAIKTHRVQFGDSLQSILDDYVSKLFDGDILAVTSKIIGVVEGQLVDKKTIDKRTLIYKEAEKVLQSKSDTGIYLTVKNGILIPSAGIDESNVDGVYVLYPKDIQQTSAWIWRYLMKRDNISKLGIIITDSHTAIMRRGVTGIGIGWCGFSPLHSYIGENDLYQHPLKFTTVNTLDSLAASAVFVMGECREQTPMAIIREAPHVNFLTHEPSKDEEDSIKISMEEDIYGPLLMATKWGK